MDRLLDSLSDRARRALFLAVAGVKWLLSGFFFLSGVGFLVTFVAQYIGLGPLGDLRGLLLPIAGAVVSFVGLGHPLWWAVSPLILGLFSLFLQQVVFIVLGGFAGRIATSGRKAPIVSRMPLPMPAPSRSEREDLQKVKERIFKVYGEHANQESVSFAVAAPDSERKREALLKRFWEIEHALKAASMKKCVFLSVDVVGSTRMKVEKNAAAVKTTFHAYDQMLRKIFRDHGSWKEAWTPDGVMVCFLDRELALAATRMLLANLPRFNSTFNKLATPFRVRCGMNEGEVAIFEDSPLEKVADRVIDVAGHMQKEAPEDSLLAPAHLYEKLADRAGFVRTDKMVDDYETWEWRSGR